MKLTHTLTKTPEFVFDYLTDMQKFASLHPVISKILKLDEDNYLVHETMKLGIIPFSFTYPVKIDKDFVTRSVTISATVMKLTKIKMHFEIKTENEMTVVHETVQFKSPLPIQSMMETIFRKQHAQLFKSMDLATN